MSEKLKGTCKWFDRRRGYGFVTDEEGKDYYVHFSSIQVPGFKSLRRDEEVTFSIGEYNGRPCAVDVVPQRNDSEEQTTA